MALRAEWCKGQERAKRYEEEVELVVEEMRRTLVTFGLKAYEWNKRATSLSNTTSGLDPTTIAGATAYTYKQADIQQRLVPVFLDDWYEMLEKQPLAATRLSKYPQPTATDNRHRLPSNVQLYHSMPAPHTNAAPQPLLISPT